MILSPIRTSNIIILSLLIFALSACGQTSQVLTSGTEDQGANSEEVPASAVETLDVTELTTTSIPKPELSENTPNNTSGDMAEPTAARDIPPTRFPASKYQELEIVTLLPPDAIPAIDDPQFLSLEAADAFYDPDELVMGVSFNGDSRAYSVPFLSNHEIVNDTVGGVKIAVTW